MDKGKALDFVCARNKRLGRWASFIHLSRLEKDYWAQSCRVSGSWIIVF